MSLLPSRVTLTIQTTNAAFRSDADDIGESLDATASEVARIFENAARRIRLDGVSCSTTFRDINGNTVATLTVEEEDV
jgi:hypothetical protein